MSLRGQTKSKQEILVWGGDFGTDVLDGAGTISGGPWGQIIAKGATTITGMTANWSDLIGDMADGESHTGTFTSVTISAGKLYLKRTAEADELPITALS